MVQDYENGPTRDALPGPRRPLGGRFTPDEEEMRETLSPAKPLDFEHPEAPPMFRPEPLVVSSDPNLIHDAHDLMHIAPGLRDHINRIQSAPTNDVFRLFSILGMDPSQAAERGTGGLLGHFGDDRNMYIRPRGIGEEDFQPQVLAHEAAHAAGYSHESGVPERMGRLGAKRTNTKYIRGRDDK
jgi:hypothetical protein